MDVRQQIPRVTLQHEAGEGRAVVEDEAIWCEVGDEAADLDYLSDMLEERREVGVRRDGGDCCCCERFRCAVRARVSASAGCRRGGEVAREPGQERESAVRGRRIGPLRDAGDRYLPTDDELGGGNAGGGLTEHRHPVAIREADIGSPSIPGAGNGLDAAADPNEEPLV